jgi:3-methylcrotonyl-CoA carboxylase alpha subunit
MFKRILIANRGEIACRVIHTCRKMGVESVAVYSDADENALHVQQADIAIHIGAAPPSESYLNGARIIEAAIGCGAEAIHPGYGFLSENAGFARAAQEAGLVFIGPDADTIQKMGSKAKAKRLMEAAGVPVVPGYHDDDQSDKTLLKQAHRIGFPLLVKAVAGGGGKGMRVVRAEQEFDDALAAARREAENAFGDDRVILERYVDAPRHIEVQIFGDRHGGYVHLYERDCSAQRRYQKIIELAPALEIDPHSGQAMSLRPELREKITSAALEAARAVNYAGAGTVEFLLEDSGHFWFMEMNTRLQVEHPVTEMVTGLDLVEWQLRVAAGEPLPLAQKDIECRGHAIEVRIYAEDPDAGFLPSCGELKAIHWPADMKDVRIETGVRSGDVISVHYDPMIAKLVAWADEPAALFEKIQEALSHTAVFGPMTNIGFLQRLIKRTLDRFGTVDTTYVDSRLEDLAANTEPDDATLLPAVVAVLQSQENKSAASAGESTDPYTPWARLDGWRNHGGASRVVKLAAAGQQWQFDARGIGGNYQITSDKQNWDVRGHPPLLEVDSQPLRAVIYRQGNEIQQITTTDRISLTVLENHSAVAEDAQQHDLLAPMPGRIIAIPVSVGERVSEGQTLLIMEAMKMELSIRAPRDAVIASLPHAEGEFVEAETLLAHFEEEAEE